VHTIFNTQISDNVKARIIHHERENEYQRNTTDIAIQSQLETYYYFKRKVEAIETPEIEEA